MARGKKKVSTAENEGVLQLVVYNEKIMENGTKKANIQIDDCVSIAIDEYNYELMKVKETLVTTENIKSATNKYGDKYKIGDSYQEWITMDKYLHSYEEAFIVYSELKFKNEASKLLYCTDATVLNKIKQKIADDITKFMTANTVPEVVKQLDIATDELVKMNMKVKTLKALEKEAIMACNDIITIVKAKRAKMIASGIIQEKTVNHKMKLEED